MNGNNIFDRHYSQGIPDQRPGFFVGILIALFFTGSIFAWVYAVQKNTDTTSAVVHIVFAVAALSLVLNLFLLFRVGYNGFAMNFFVNYVLALILTIAGFYIFNIQTPAANPNDGRELWRFLFYLLASGLMNGLPTFAISGIMWILMAMFGDM